VPRATPTRQQRKKKAPATTRAFLFSDLRDYTSYVEAKGDAAAARLLKDYRTLVRREVARHEGAEVKTEGDSFYVVFETPSSAVDCAVAVLRAAEIRSAKDPTAPLRIGVGVHAGQTVAHDDQFVGSAVNIASRLAGKASAGELLISDTLRGLVRTSTTLPMKERGPLELKGVSEMIRAWSVLWQPDETRSAPVAPPPIATARRQAPTGQFLCPVVVGRSTESAALTERLDQAAEGAGSTVMLGGEAGVGKSAFVRQATDLALTRGFRVLNGLTHQSDAGLPYGPFVSAVRSGFRGLDRDELGRVLQRSAPDLAELFPELGRTARAESTGIERHRLSVAFQHLFRSFTREAPVLVVLEDLHWADEASLELLQHLARELRDARILILATYRSDEMHRRHPLLRTLAELQRERLVTEIALKRLTPDETRELIRATFAPTHPTITVSTEFRDAIYSRSEGNPFFTEELLKALVESGGIYYTEGSGWDRKPIGELEIPGSIREAVRARVERLSPEARTTLSAAAVIGLQFSFDLLRTVLAADERALETHLREFIEAQLVLEAGDGGDAYAFRHALTREVVYDDLLVRERKRLHRGVADALAASRDAEPALIAHHLLAAGERVGALPHLLAAGDRASRVDAPREAVTHYERAVEIGLADEQLAPTLERIAEAYHLFDLSRSLSAANEAASLYRELGDTRGVSRMLRLASRDHWLKGEGDEARALATEAIEVLGGSETVELARATVNLAGLRMTNAELEEAQVLADRAIALGKRFDDHWTVANAYITKGSTMRDAPPERQLELHQAGIELARRHGLAVTALRGYNNGVVAMGRIPGHREASRAFLRDGIAWGRQHGLERAAMGYPISQLAWLEVNSGDFDAALAMTHEMDERIAYGQQTWMSLARNGPIATRQKAVEFAELGLRAREAQAFVPALESAAVVLALAGDVAGAKSWLARLRERVLREPGIHSWLDSGWLPYLLTAALRCDELDWCDLVERARTPGVFSFPVARDGLIAAARALSRSDAVAAGAGVAAAERELRRMDVAAIAAMTVVLFLVETRHRDVAITDDWRDAVLTSRAFAEKAKANWWLEELTKSGY
jgi:class 3 adenylate cyclase